MTFKIASIVPVWFLALVGGLLVGLLSPSDEYFTWLPIVFAGAVLITFVIQLAVVRKDGLVLRVMSSIGGSLVILAVTTGILALVAA
ncbi:hypothetical protein [Glaciihabitans sp. dw_435]|uniref:hypothetical protein n=1 Tax=Glaciihabitans sp. dw_435 TaxID=2720081 RepID=UPI001BD3225E|nr:hypothetical protein [Glaciihabitans sp. dw_435]